MKQTSPLTAIFIGILLIACSQTSKPNSSSSVNSTESGLPQIDVGTLGAPTGKPVTQYVADSVPPTRGFVWVDSSHQVYVDNEANKIGKPNPAMAEIFVFSEKDRTAGAPSGPVLTVSNSPVRLVMYSMNFANAAGGACGLYSNLILDFSSMKQPLNFYSIGEEKTTEGVFCCRINLSVNGAKELFVSPTYIVFPNLIRIIQADGPFVRLGFYSGVPDGTDTIPANSVLVVYRNGTELCRTMFPKSGEYDIGLKRVRNLNDVITWRVEGNAGKITHQGTLGFPVSGSVPDIARYDILVTDYPAIIAK